MKWGIDVPGDHNQLIYVWFDALLSYLTSAEKLGLLDFGQSNHQLPFLKTDNFQMINVVGKDILKFHSNMWPLMLSGLGLGQTSVDQNLVCHSHWVKDNRKMSKSLGNIVDPWEVLTRYPLEAFKFYILVNGPLSKDSNFDEEDMVNLYNTFVDKVVNCYSRILAKNGKKNCQFDFSADELFSFAADLHKEQSLILKEINFAKAELNPGKM